MNASSLDKLSEIRQKLDAQFTLCFSLKAQGAIASASDTQKKDFAKRRDQLGLCVAELKNAELSLILDRLQESEIELRNAITGLENQTDDFQNFVATIAAIASVVNIVAQIIGPLPI